jgi:hypothetical protein
MAGDDVYAELCNEVHSRLARAPRHELQEEDAIRLAPQGNFQMQYAEMDMMGGLWVRYAGLNAEQEPVFEVLETSGFSHVQYVPYPPV